MAAVVFTSSIPTLTVYDLTTSLSRSLTTGRGRVTATTTILTEALSIDEDGDIVTVTNSVRSRYLTISTATATRTVAVVDSVAVDTLYEVILSTSTPVVVTTSTSTTPTTSRVPLTRPTPTTSSDDVVVVTQFTTITPTLAAPSTTGASTSSTSSTTSSSSSTSSTSSTSRSAGSANDQSAFNSSNTGSSLSSGAIAGIVVGAIAIAIILGILGFLFCCRRRKGRHDSMYATTGGRSDEKLAPALFNPDYNGSRSVTSPRQMANIGAAGVSSIAGIGAGMAGAGAGGGSRSSGTRRSSGYNGGNSGSAAYYSQRRSSNGHGNGVSSVPTSGKNKPVPDVPPPVSNLQFARPAPTNRSSSYDDQHSDLSYKSPYGGNASQYYSPSRPYEDPSYAAGIVGAGAGAAGAAAMGSRIGRPTSAGPSLPNQVPRGQNAGYRTSAPPTSMLSASALANQQEKEAALKRAKSVASVKSIASDKLGKGAGYASPMPPVDPLGKPIDQKTWRERQRQVKDGVSPDILLTAEQKMRRDSQLAKLQAAQAGTASAKPGLSKLQEQVEPGEKSPLLSMAGEAFGDSPPRAGAVYAPVPVRSRAVSPPPTTTRQVNTRSQAETILPYASPEASSSRQSNPFADVRSSSRSPPQSQPQVPSSSGQIFPPLPPVPASNTSARLSQSYGPGKQSFQIYQPEGQTTTHNPIRASFIAAPLSASAGPTSSGSTANSAASANSTSNSSTAGPPPAPSTQGFGNRLPAIPGSRPNSVALSAGTTLPDYRSNYSSAAVNVSSPYAAASPQPASPFFQQQNRSSGSFGQRMPVHASIADDIYGGLTQGLSDRDIARLSFSKR